MTNWEPFKRAMSVQQQQRVQSKELFCGFPRNKNTTKRNKWTMEDWIKKEQNREENKNNNKNYNIFY